MSKKKWGIFLGKGGPILVPSEKPSEHLMKFGRAKSKIIDILEKQLEFYKKSTPDNYKYNILEAILSEQESETKAGDSSKRDT